LDEPQVVLAYPLRIVHGSVATASRPAHVRQMIEQVLFTRPGERVMLPDFGVGLELLLFETTGSERLALTQSQVGAALTRWLGDIISVRDVAIAVRESTMTIDVTYELIETQALARERFEL
jgi:phage baseplate assembly protein W